MTSDQARPGQKEKHNSQGSVPITARAKITRAQAWNKGKEDEGTGGGPIPARAGSRKTQQELRAEPSVREEAYQSSGLVEG
jgi:hypothetical protein